MKIEEKKKCMISFSINSLPELKGKGYTVNCFQQCTKEKQGPREYAKLLFTWNFCFSMQTVELKKWLHTKQTMIHFIVGNEQCFPLLLGTNNTFRIFTVLLETKSALVIKISQLHCLFIVWNSELANICFLGDLTFFWVTLLKFWATWLQLRWFSGNLTVNS